MSSQTLNEFFGISVKGFWDEILGKLQGVGSLSELKGKVFGQLTPEHWPQVASGIGDKVSELFNVDVGLLLVSAWQKYGELKEYADPKKYARDESKMVPLAKHSLKVAYSPYLEVLFNGRRLGKIIFDVTLEFELEGFLLTIQSGKIMKVRTGTCYGSGKIELYDRILLKKALSKFLLPGTIELGEGISLGRGNPG
ncbi:MAG: hypothetical protein ACREQV_15930 [Candidatus Binatia bacterium]